MTDTQMLAKSPYERRANDAYYTQPRVTQALLDAIKLRGRVWEPASGRQDMVRVLEQAGYQVFASDLAEDRDTVFGGNFFGFLRAQRGYETIITQRMGLGGLQNYVIHRQAIPRETGADLPPPLGLVGNRQAAGGSRYQPGGKLGPEEAKGQPAAQLFLVRVGLATHWATDPWMAVVTQPSSFQRARIGERAEITRIKKAVATVYGVPVAQMEGAPRGNEAVVHARHVAMWVARKLTTATWAEIGRRFGRSPSSVSAAVKNLVYLDRDHAHIRAIERQLGVNGCL